MPRRLNIIAQSARCFSVVVALILFASCGCRSLRPSDGEGLFSGGLLSTDNIRGPLERAVTRDEDAITRGEKFSPEGQRKVDEARRLFDDGKYAEAAKSYKALAKKYENSSIGEEAWFRTGECYFALKKYADAEDAYEKLFADYPSTKYVADTSQRLFEIAKIWLDVTDPVSSSGDIKTVSAEKEIRGADTPPPSRDPTARYGLLPNFHDGSRPIFDTAGRARNALKSIWLNDPTGPLADDALMLTAAYYLKRGNYLEADRYFEILRDEYPDSPHLEDAFVMGGHVKQMSYQGPYYDGTSLASAENLKERTLQMFPNSEERPRLRQELQEVYLMKAQRAWGQVEFYRRKSNPTAVAIQCVQVVNDYPDTQYGELARRELLKTDPKLVRHLPGVSEFIASLPQEPLGPPQQQQEEERPPRVKSVGFTRDDSSENGS